MAQILVIDDEDDFREGVCETLGDLGHTFRGVASVSDALTILQSESFDAIFLDFTMPQIDGLEAIPLLKQKSPAPIIIITAHLGSENAISAMRLGAFDHLTKPIGRADIESVLTSLANAFPDRKPGKAAQFTAKPAADRSDLVGQSPQMREVFKLIGRLAASDSSVLITGETGTGKEVVAKSIHANSARAGGPFIAVNCAAIPEELLESELFGHVKGAYTGAVADRRGSFQLAENGTLFLDEIGDMHPGLQAKLLRALQEREITPVGASKVIRINARFLAATHQNLPLLVERKEFREDLYYRLNVVELPLPPLRERTGDIELLSQTFVKQLGGENFELSKQAIAKLNAHSWPGNIRELRNVMERAIVIARGNEIGINEIRFLADSRVDSKSPSGSLDLPQAVAELEQRMISEALIEANGNRSEAARRLGIPRQLLYSKMKEHRIV